MSELTVRILSDVDEKTGSQVVVETREVHYDGMRLTRGRKMQLVSSFSQDRFTELDIDKATRAKDGEMPDGSIKSLDVTGMNDAREKAMNECTKILFGLGDVKLDNIVDEDFEPLYKIAVEKNPLGFIDIKKKTKESK